MPAGPALTAPGPQLELLHEAPGLPTVALPRALADAYGGDLGFRPPVLYGNLVSSLDGVAALGGTTPPAVLAEWSRADRFVMGLLRAFAEAILVGASTLRAEPRHRWLPENVYADGAADFARLRSALGLPEHPRLVVVTASGRLDTSLPALAGGALVLTTGAGAAALRSSVRPGLTVRPLGEGPRLDGSVIIRAVREEGHRTVLTEGGPHLIGTLLGADVLGELFLTLSPVLAGDRAAAGRRGAVEGARFGPDGLRRAGLLSARRHGSHLFLRYAIGSARP